MQPVYDSLHWTSKLSASGTGNGAKLASTTVEAIPRATHIDWIRKPILCSPSKSIPRNGVSDVYNYLPQNDHSSGLGEMMFGSIPELKGMGTKIYYINSPDPQILLTKLFSVYLPFETEPTLEQANGSNACIAGNPVTSQSAYADVTHRPGSPTELYPRDKSSTSPTKTQIPANMGNEDVYGVFSDRLPDPVSSKHIRFAVMPGENEFYTDKRMRKFLDTSLEYGKFHPTRMLENESQMYPAPKHGPRFINYSLGIILSLDDDEDQTTLEASESARACTNGEHRMDDGMNCTQRRHSTLHDFVFSHYALLEGKMHQLQVVFSETVKRLFRERYATNEIVYGPHYKSTGLSLQVFSYPIPHPDMRKEPKPYLIPLAMQPDVTILEAVKKFKRGVVELYATPRIQEPLWLNMLSFPERRTCYAAELMTELIWLIEKYDTKNTEFFISTLITVVLAHHLAWVPTVTHPDEELPNNCGKKGKNGIATTLPYNPLWAQLSDLYGNLCLPSKMSRTVVVGTEESLVSRILFILTYFMRCNQVVEMPEETEKMPSLDSLLEEDIRSKGSPGKDSGMGGSLRNGESGDCENDDVLWGFPKRDASQDLVDGYVVVNIPKSPSAEQYMDHESIPHTFEAKRADVCFTKSYGRSLFASYCHQYMSDFVLMGVPNFDFEEAMKSDMKDSVTSQVLEEPVSRTACIVADTNAWRCNVFRYDHESQTFACIQPRAAAFVVDMLSGVRDLARPKRASILSKRDSVNYTSEA